MKVTWATQEHMAWAGNAPAALGVRVFRIQRPGQIYGPYSVLLVGTEVCQPILAGDGPDATPAELRTVAHDAAADMVTLLWDGDPESAAREAAILHALGHADVARAIWQAYDGAVMRTPSWETATETSRRAVATLA